MLSSERLTYLMSIATAVIGWAVVQISADVSQSKMVSYQVSQEETTNRKKTSLLLVNSSVKQNPGVVTVDFIAAGAAPEVKCALAFEQDGLGVSPLGSTEPEVTEFAARTILDAMHPGTRYKFNISYNSSCLLTYQVVFVDQNTRILERGLETFVLENRFEILATLVVIFTIVFIITFIKTRSNINKISNLPKGKSTV